MSFFTPISDQEYERSIRAVRCLLITSFFTLCIFQAGGCLVIGGGKSKAPPVAELCPPCPAVSEEEQARAAWATECGGILEAGVTHRQGGQLTEESQAALRGAEQQCVERWREIN